jgi:hypothetical protein
MLKFLPDVEKILAQARKKKTQLEQLDFVFKAIPDACICKASELTIEKRNAFCDFYRLKVIEVPRPKKDKRERHTESL